MSHKSVLLLFFFGQLLFFGAYIFQHEERHAWICEAYGGKADITWLYSGDRVLLGAKTHCDIHFNHYLQRAYYNKLQNEWDNIQYSLLSGMAFSTFLLLIWILVRKRDV